MNLTTAASFRLVLFALVSAALFAGCCGSVSCECPGKRPDALVFTFNADSVGTDPAGFRGSDVDTVLIVRSVYPRDTANVTTSGTTYARPDTARLIRLRRTAVSQPVIIDNTTPFSAVNGRKLGSDKPDESYRYTIILPSRGPGRRPLPLPRYYIGRVGLDGKDRADKCCTCYINTRKTFYFKPLANSRQPERLVDATDPAGQNDTVAFQLRRR